MTPLGSVPSCSTLWLDAPTPVPSTSSPVTCLLTQYVSCLLIPCPLTLYPFIPPPFHPTTPLFVLRPPAPSLLTPAPVTREVVLCSVSPYPLTLPSSTLPLV